MYCVENRENRKYLQANLVFNITTSETLCIMLKTEKIEINVHNFFSKITTSETRMYYVENGKNRK